MAILHQLLRLVAFSGALIFSILLFMLPMASFSSDNIEPTLTIWPGMTWSGGISGDILAVSYGFADLPNTASAVINKVTYAFQLGSIIRLSATPYFYHLASVAGVTEWTPFGGGTVNNYTTVFSSPTNSELDNGINLITTFGRRDVNIGIRQFNPKYEEVLAEASISSINKVLWSIETGFTATDYSVWASVSQSSTAIGGATTEYIINHSLNNDVLVQVFENFGSYNQVLAEIEYLDADNIRITFEEAPSSNAYLVNILSASGTQAIGDGASTEYSVSTSTATRNTFLQVRENTASGAFVRTSISHHTVSSVTIGFDQAPASNSYLVMWVPIGEVGTDFGTQFVALSGSNNDLMTGSHGNSAITHRSGSYQSGVGVVVTDFSNDITLGDSSEEALITEYAVRGYIDNNFVAHDEIIPDTSLANPYLTPLPTITPHDTYTPQPTTVPPTVVPAVSTFTPLLIATDNVLLYGTPIIGGGTKLIVNTPTPRNNLIYDGSNYDNAGKPISFNDQADGIPLMRFNEASGTPVAWIEKGNNALRIKAKAELLLDGDWDNNGGTARVQAFTDGGRMDANAGNLTLGFGSTIKLTVDSGDINLHDDLHLGSNSITNIDDVRMSTASFIPGVTPGDVSGRMYYNLAEDILYAYDGTIWVDLFAGIETPLPTSTPPPTPVPTLPQPTLVATATPIPAVSTVTPRSTDTPIPPANTATPIPADTPRPTVTPRVTDTPVPILATVTPQPTATVQPVGTSILPLNNVFTGALNTFDNNISVLGNIAGQGISATGGIDAVTVVISNSLSVGTTETGGNILIRAHDPTGVAVSFLTTDGNADAIMTFKTDADGTPRTGLITMDWSTEEFVFSNNVVMDRDLVIDPAGNITIANGALTVSGTTEIGGNLNVLGNVLGSNVTSGANPGHTHTGTSLSSIDISDDTNLVAGTNLTLSNDTMNLSGTIADSFLEATIDRTGFNASGSIDIGGNLTLSGAGSTISNNLTSVNIDDDVDINGGLIIINATSLNNISLTGTLYDPFGPVTVDSDIDIIGSATANRFTITDKSNYITKFGSGLDFRSDAQLTFREDDMLLMLLADLSGSGNAFLGLSGSSIFEVESVTATGNISMTGVLYDPAGTLTLNDDVTVYPASAGGGFIVRNSANTSYLFYVDDSFGLIAPDTFFEGAVVNEQSVFAEVLFNVESGVTIGALSTNNLIDDSSNGSGSATLYVGNKTIDTTFTDKHDYYLGDLDLLSGECVYLAADRRIYRTIQAQDKRAIGIYQGVSSWEDAFGVTFIESVTKAFQIGKKKNKKKFKILENKKSDQKYAYSVACAGDSIDQNTNALLLGAWVTVDAGIIENGDYLCSSSKPGYLEKQDDDLWHTYTVGQARERIEVTTRFAYIYLGK